MLQLKWQLTLADLLQELSQLIPEVSVFLPALPARASLLYTIYYIRFSVKSRSGDRSYKERSAISSQQSAVSNQKEWQSAVSSIRGRDREIAPTVGEG